MATTSKTKRAAALSSAFLFATLSAAVALIATTGCSATSHANAPTTMGAVATGTSMERVVDEPGPVTVETVVGADWVVPLSGMLNLDHPKAKAAGLKDRDENIVIQFHVIRHPTRGMYLIDTGVERALFDAPDEAAIQGIVASFAHVDKMKRHIDTKTWIDRNADAAHGGPVKGVFLTHLHLDHVSGMRDVPAGTPVFVGPNEANAKSFENIFVAPTVNRALENKPPLQVLPFTPDPDGTFEGVLDVFGDGSFFAILVPGHTPGSTAYVARTPTGPVLFTGDTCHTAWGWENGVEPGSFTADQKRNAISLERLRTFAARHPKMIVRLGHQSLKTPQ